MQVKVTKPGQTVTKVAAVHQTIATQPGAVIAVTPAHASDVRLSVADFSSGNTVAIAANALAEAVEALITANNALDTANAAIVQSHNANLFLTVVEAVSQAANAQATQALNQSNIAIFAANTALAQSSIIAIAANTVQVSVNARSTFYNKHLNFANTSTVQVFGSDRGDGTVNLSFLALGGAGNGNVIAGIQSISTGLGLSGGPIDTVGTIIANIASTTQQGISLLIDSLSTDTGNAATANIVSYTYNLANTANSVAAAALPLTGGTIAGNLNVNTLTTNTAIIGSFRIDNTLTQTTANAVAVLVDAFPAGISSVFKYLISVSSTAFNLGLEMMCMHDGLDSYSTIYAILANTDDDVGDFDVIINGPMINLLYTPNNPMGTIITINVRRESMLS